MRAGRYYADLRVVVKNQLFNFYFGFNKDLIKIVKEQFEGRRFVPETKHWTAPITYRNIFRLEALRKSSHDAYSMWSTLITDDRLAFSKEVFKRFMPEGTKPFNHQLEIFALMYFNRRTIIGADMGLGKTLCAIMLIKQLAYEGYDVSKTIWLSSKGCIPSTKREFKVWGLEHQPIISTYESLKNVTKDWQGAAPRILIADESIRVMNAERKRSKACRYVTDSMRDEHMHDCWISLLCGRPAPTNPTNWHGQMETCSPGFLVEATSKVMRERIGDIEYIDGPTGQYPKNHGWKEDELEKFGKRASGMVGCWFKKDCVDLPEKRYVEIKCKPTTETLNYARSIVNTATSTLRMMNDLRQLSDGFLYKRTKVDELEQCPGCDGSGKQNIPLYDENKIFIEFVADTCFHCKGEKRVQKEIRKSVEIGTAKDDVLRSELEIHESVGRLVTYCGFQASVDRVAQLSRIQGWHSLKVDGRGWLLQDPEGKELSSDGESCLEAFMTGKIERINFVGQPDAAGEGLTLIVSPTILYFSNSYNPKSREQSEDRIHRIGMDVNRGATIKDILHLPSDLKILRTLQNRQMIQKLTLDSIRAELIGEINATERQ